MQQKTPVMRFLLALGFACGLVASCSSPSSQVEEIVNSNIAARGGRDRIQALQSMRATGTATASGGRVARVVQEIKRPGLYRLEFSSQGTTAVFAHDGSIGWHVAPLQGVFEPQPVTPDNHSEAGIDERDIEGPLVDWREKGHNVELVGREALAGGEAFKLKVTLSDGTIRYDYIDVASRQVVRTDKTETIRGRVGQLEQTFSDFREVDGLVFPFFIESHVKDRPKAIKIVVEEIELNPEIENARFAMPQ